MDITHLHLLLSVALDMIRISILHLTYFYFIATPTVGSQNLLVINYSRVKRNLDLALSGCVIGLFYLYHVGSYYNLLWAIEKKSFLLATKLNRTKNQTHLYKVCNYNLRSDIRDLVCAVPTEKMLQVLQKNIFIHTTLIFKSFFFLELNEN